MKKFVKIYNEFLTQLKDDNVNAYAGSCAFFIFLSLIPIVILILAILPYTPVTQNDLINFCADIFPESMIESLIKIIEEVYEKSVGVISVSAIAAFWSAGKGVNSLVYGLNSIDNYLEKRNTLWIRISSCIYTILFITSIVLILIIMVYGGIAVDIIVGYFPKLANLLELFMVLRTIIMIVFMTIIFMLIYAFLPCKRHRFLHQIPGAMFTACAWTIFSYFFFLYIDNTNAFSMYGSLTMIVILLIWLYVLMYLVLFGANINRYISPFVNAYERKNLDK